MLSARAIRRTTASSDSVSEATKVTVWLFHMKSLLSFIQRHVLIDGDNVVQYVLAFMPSALQAGLSYQQQGFKRPRIRLWL